MDAHELEVLKHYTANGHTHIAMIPQHAVPPGEQWFLDFVGIDLERRGLLYIEVSSSQRPTARTLDKDASEKRMDSGRPPALGRGVSGD